ncbi:Hypothetical predicted protein, partial [Pelobates cultripes]
MPTLRIWSRIRHQTDVSPHPSPFYPLAHNPNFLPGLRPQFFHQFPPTQKTRYPMVSTVITPKGIAPLSVLTSTDHPTSQQYFQYAQLSHFLKGESHLLRGTRAHTKYETYCTTHSLQIKHLSIFYKLLNTINLTPLPHSQLHGKLSWGSPFQW